MIKDIKITQEDFYKVSVESINVSDLSSSNSEFETIKSKAQSISSFLITTFTSSHTIFILFLLILLLNKQYHEAKRTEICLLIKSILIHEHDYEKDNLMYEIILKKRFDRQDIKDNMTIFIFMSKEV